MEKRVYIYRQEIDKHLFTRGQSEQVEGTGHPIS